MFPRLEYLEWISGRHEVALYDLATSDLRGDRNADPEVVPEPLAGRSDPPAGASLEMMVAGEYGVEPEQVLVTPGATGANLLAAATAIDEAEAKEAEEASEDSEPVSPRVLVEKPGYEPLVKSPKAFGATVDRFLRGDDFRLEPERIENALLEETCLVTLSNRHNPSGRLADRETLSEAAEVVRESGARMLVDEVYAPFVGTDSVDDVAEGGAFGGVTAVDLEGTVVTGSISKFYGLRGLRVGWLIADEEFVAHARSISHHFPSVAEPSRALAMRAFHHADDLEARARQLLAENAEQLAEFVMRRDDVTGYVGSESTFAFLNPEGITGDELAEAAWEEGVLVVPGRFFDDPERVRISLGRAPHDVAAGLDSLGEILDHV